MSNRRRPARGNSYRTGYLRSPAWYARRARWFRDEATLTHGAVRCAVCTVKGTPRTLELHHLSYDGVASTAGRWTANEAHGDLVAVCPDHHRLIHQLTDRDPVLRDHRSRRAANREAIARLRRRLTQRLHSMIAAIA